MVQQVNFAYCQQLIYKQLDENIQVYYRPMNRSSVVSKLSRKAEVKVDYKCQASGELSISSDNSLVCAAVYRLIYVTTHTNVNVTSPSPIFIIYAQWLFINSCLLSLPTFD